MICFFRQIVWHSCEPYCSSLTFARRCIVPPQLSITCLLHMYREYSTGYYLANLGEEGQPSKNLTWQLFGAKNAWLQFLVDIKEPSTEYLIVLITHALCSSVNCFKFLIQVHCTYTGVFVHAGYFYVFKKLGKVTLFTSFTFVNNIWIVKNLAEIFEFQKEIH